MLYTAIAFFSLAALLGMFLLSYVLQDKETPKAVAFAHGAMAATGVILLITYSFYRSPTPMISLILFVMAALGGLFLIFTDLTGKPIPKWMALGHGLTAITGYIFLLVFTFK